MGTTTAGVLVFFGVIFFLGGVVVLVGGSVIGATILGIFGLIFIWAGAHHASKTKEKLQQKLRDYGY